jgi:hypothetical protein
MKTNKWLSWFLGIVISLAALGAVGFYTFRMGYSQGASTMHTAMQAQIDAAADKTGKTDGTTTAQVLPPFFGHQHGFGDDFGFMDHDQMMGYGQFGRGMMNGGRMMGGQFGFGGFFPIFGLFQLAFWGLVIWVAYKLISNSGWKLVKTNTPATVSVDEKNA